MADLSHYELMAKRLVIDDVRQTANGNCSSASLLNFAGQTSAPIAVTMWPVLLVTLIAIVSSDKQPRDLLEALGESMNHSPDDCDNAIRFIVELFDHYPTDGEGLSGVTDWLYTTWVAEPDNETTEELNERTFAIVEGIHMLRHMAAHLSRGRETLLTMLQGEYNDN